MSVLFAPREVARFEAKFNRGATSDCWEWIASVTSDGYGRFRAASGVGVAAHRFAYEFYVGRIPQGLVIDHLCRNRRCVNPAHLEPVTHAENVRRGVGAERAAAARRARTHCVHNHPLEPGNILTDAAGHRRCKTCRRIADHKRHTFLGLDCRCLEHHLAAVGHTFAASDTPDGHVEGDCETSGGVTS